MEIVCREDLNTIFWRDSRRDDWNHADLDEVIKAYDTDEPYTELEYEFPVKRESTDEVLYHAFKCKKCEQIVVTVDINHDYRFCPHCGRAIL